MSRCCSSMVCQIHSSLVQFDMNVRERKPSTSGSRHIQVLCEELCCMLCIVPQCCCHAESATDSPQRSGQHQPPHLHPICSPCRGVALAACSPLPDAWHRSLTSFSAAFCGASVPCWGQSPATLPRFAHLVTLCTLCLLLCHPALLPQLGLAELACRLSAVTVLLLLAWRHGVSSWQDQGIGIVLCQPGNHLGRVGASQSCTSAAGAENSSNTDTSGHLMP